MRNTTTTIILPTVYLLYSFWDSHNLWPFVCAVQNMQDFRKCCIIRALLITNPEYNTFAKLNHVGTNLRFFRKYNITYMFATCFHSYYIHENCSDSSNITNFWLNKTFTKNYSICCYISYQKRTNLRAKMFSSGNSSIYNDVQF